MSEPSIPQYLTGTRYSNVFVAPVSVAAGGVITVATPADLAAGQVFDEFEIQRSFGLTEISATSSGIENFVETKETFTATLSEIRQINGTSHIDTMVGGGTRYVKILVNTSGDGGATLGQTDAVLMILDTSSKRSDVGRNTVSISGRPCGVAPYTGTGTVPF